MQFLSQRNLYLLIVLLEIIGMLLSKLITAGTQLIFTPLNPLLGLFGLAMSPRSVNHRPEHA